MPGSASVAGVEPSIDGWSGWSATVLGFATLPRPRLVSARAMDEWSAGRLASWWNTLRFRMIVYTKLELPAQISEVAVILPKFPSTQTRIKRLANSMRRLGQYSEGSSSRITEQDAELQKYFLVCECMGKIGSDFLFWPKKPQECLLKRGLTNVPLKNALMWPHIHNHSMYKILFTALHSPSN